MASMTDIRKALNSLDLDELGAAYEHIGIRVQEESYGLTVGDTMEHNSHIWEDGDDTEEEIDGVCAMNVKSLNMISCEYFGQTILVLGSYDVEYGEDLGEIIMRDAEVLAIINL